MTVGGEPPPVEDDFCLKPPDGSPATTPSQPSKRARASSSAGFSGEGGMDFAVVTAIATKEDATQMDTNLKMGNQSEAKDMETESGGPKASYKDSFLGNSPPDSIPEGDELMSDESDGEETEDDPDCPTIRIKKSTDARVRNRWNEPLPSGSG
ncbi:unnamed protein product [Linum trigynum]|uniref:Uncharacterized protein n=1 Tax=Linum trigynum TaxID=586398 RepID=A0AAV2CJ71_9ROSI